MHPHPVELTDLSPIIHLLSNSQIIKQIGRELGFQQVGITDAELDPHHQHYDRWIARNFHGEMAYMARNTNLRLDPAELVPNTVSVICVRLDYLPAEQQDPRNLLDHDSLAYVSRYALGRDYHKKMRKRLQKFADRIAESCADMGYRVFTDSAPVLEKALAVKAGIGWQGKHSNLLHREHGSWFSSVRYILICSLKSMHHWRITVVDAAVVSTFVPPQRSWSPIWSMQDAAYHT